VNDAAHIVNGRNSVLMVRCYGSASGSPQDFQSMVRRVHSPADFGRWVVALRTVRTLRRGCHSIYSFRAPLPIHPGARADRASARRGCRVVPGRLHEHDAHRGILGSRRRLRAPRVHRLFN